MIDHSQEVYAKVDQSRQKYTINCGKSTGSIFMILILKNVLIQFATEMKQSLA